MDSGPYVPMKSHSEVSGGCEFGGCSSSQYNGLHVPAFLDDGHTPEPRPQTLRPPARCALLPLCPPSCPRQLLTNPPSLAVLRVPPPTTGTGQGFHLCQPPTLPPVLLFLSAPLSAPRHQPKDGEARTRLASDLLGYLGGRRGSKVPQGQQVGGPGLRVRPGARNTPSRAHT